MNLSLEVKKFMNNEHTGEFVNVVLPSELPVDRTEVREHNRDKNAAHTAKNVADNKARLASKARERVENTTKLRSLKEEELTEAKAILEDIVSQQRAMQPDLDQKRDAYDKAAADFDEKNSIYTVKLESFEAMESAYNAAVEAENAALLVLNDCRANFSGAESALAAAKEDGVRHEGRLSSTRSEVAETRVLYEKAAEEAKDIAAVENEKTARFNSLSEEAAERLAISKKEAKRLSDAQKNVVSTAKEYTKAASDHASVLEALTDAENQVKESDRADKDALKARASSLRSKLAAAAARMENADAAKKNAEKELSDAEEANDAAQVEYNKIREILNSSKAELDDVKARSAALQAKAAEAQAKYSSVSSSFEKSQGDVEYAAMDVKNREADLVNNKKALLNAETDVSRRHEDVLSAREEMEKSRSVMNDKLTIMRKSEKVYNTKKAAFDSINSSYQMAERDRRTQKNVCDRLEIELRQLNDQLEDDINARDNALEEARYSEEEAERKRLSIRAINSKYETVKIHYLQQGKGEDILLIHSVGQSLYTFRELISRLSSKFRVTAIDLVGFGYSEKPYYFGYSLNEMADFIARFMDAMEMETAHLFGFSMGAGYVINFAKRYPQRVGRIVLLSPGGITPDMPASIKSLESRIFGGIASRLISYKSVKKMLSECYFDLTNHTDDLVNEYYKPISNPDSKRIIRTCVTCYDDEEVIHSLRDVNAPTLLLWGNEDKWHTPDMANLFRAVMPNVNYTLVRNAGHLAHEEKADRIAQLIKNFIPCGYDGEEEETSFQ